MSNDESKILKQKHFARAMGIPHSDQEIDVMHPNKTGEDTDKNYAPFEDWFLGCHGEIHVRPQNMGGGWQAFGHIVESDHWQKLWEDIDFSRSCIDAIAEAEGLEHCYLVNNAPTDQIAYSRCMDGMREMHKASIESLKGKLASKLPNYIES